ncbi:MAG: hypothetical protein LBL73_01955 [Synergistaceae bacterium]|jgi:rubredoxin|nr:hypothetical protein [Synergistaceae bacterium]
MTTAKHACPICGEYAFEYANSYDICPVCHWEDEEYQIKHPDEEDGPNGGMSLNQYRAEWEKRRKTA